MKEIAYSGQACFSQKLDIARFTGNTFNDILVLESNPEQSYFFSGNLPEEMPHANDHHLYLVVRHTIPCFQDKIIRHSYYLRDELKMDLHISPGQMTFGNETHACIRIRINELGLIQDFVEELEQLGIEFFCGRHYKHLKPFKSIVQFKKYVDMERLDEGTFRNAHNPHTHFVEIPSDIEYSEFETMIGDIKANCSLNMFNAALVYLPQREKVMNFVALYSRECNEEKLPQLAAFLEKEITRLKG